MRIALSIIGTLACFIFIQIQIASAQEATSPDSDDVTERISSSLLWLIGFPLLAFVFWRECFVSSAKRGDPPSIRHLAKMLNDALLAPFFKQDKNRWEYSFEFCFLEISMALIGAAIFGIVAAASGGVVGYIWGSFDIRRVLVDPAAENWLWYGGVSGGAFGFVLGACVAYFGERARRSSACEPTSWKVRRIEGTRVCFRVPEAWKERRTDRRGSSMRIWTGESAQMNVVWVRSGASEMPLPPDSAGYGKVHRVHINGLAVLEAISPNNNYQVSLVDSGTEMTFTFVQTRDSEAHDLYESIKMSLKLEESDGKTDEPATS